MSLIADAATVPPTVPPTVDELPPLSLLLASSAVYIEMMDTRGNSVDWCGLVWVGVGFQFETPIQADSGF
jgi:hypothetical protein